MACQQRPGGRGGCRKTLDAPGRTVRAVIEHPRVALRDLLKVGQLGEDTGNRGSGCREKRVERLKRGMARRLTCQIGGCVVADPFKTLLFVKRGLRIAISFSVVFNCAAPR